MATGWSVLVFGDSWADYMHPTWPQVLGRRLSAQVFNFAQGGSLCADLLAQAQRALVTPQVPRAAGGLLRLETLVVVHTCGNDFVMKLAEVLLGGGGLLGGLLGGMGGAMGGGMGGAMGGGVGGGGTPEILRANPGRREVELLGQFIETMYEGGARHFLVSGVPAFLEMPIFNLLWPIIGNMVNQGKLEDLGVGPGDPPQLALQVQAASLYERWSELVENFNRQHSDATCVFFDEVAALEHLRDFMGAPTFDRMMWDMSMFHPTAWGHEQLSAEAYRCVLEYDATLAALFPASGVQLKVKAKAKPAAEAAHAAEGSDEQSRAEARPEPAVEAASAAEGSCKQQVAEEVPKKGDAEVPEKGNVQGDVPRPITLRIRNVKGDMAFTLVGDAGWRVARLREAVIKEAPSSIVPAGASCLLALKGKFLEDGAETLAQLGIGEGTPVIAVLRPAKST